MHAHDITFDVVKKSPAVIIRAGYSGAEPVSWASITIFSSSEEKTPYQNGRTDKEGYFAFVPDAPGTWTVQIDDELGHKGQTVVTVSKDFFSDASSGMVNTRDKQQTDFAGIRLVYRILMGLLFIFGATGFFYGMKSRTRVKD